MKPKKQIEEATKGIEKVMRENLNEISKKLISKIMGKAKGLVDSKRLQAIAGIEAKGDRKYKSDMKAAMAVVASMALDEVRKEVPAAKNVKLMENEASLMLGEFEELPPAIKRRINASNLLLIGTQLKDLEKAIFFQYISSVQAEKTQKEIEFDMSDKAEKYIEGNAIHAGAAVVASSMVNEARNAFFFDDETLKEIEAFQFMNESPVATICRDLAGKIFPKNDPDHFRFTPPLHYNCKSWIRPILKLKKAERAEKLRPTKAGVDSIQFSENKVSDIISRKICQCCL